MSNPLTITAPEGQPIIETSREFDAPVEAVFAAHRDPDLYVQWVGPYGYEMVIERHDFVSQGGYRFCHRNEAGEEFWFNGVFHTVRENDFAIQTFEWEGAPDQVSLESLRFVDLGDGRTRLEGRAVYLSQEARDAMVASGMEKGVAEGYERLDSLLASTAAR